MSCVFDVAVECPFRREAEAKSWRSEAMRVVAAGSTLSTPGKGRTLGDALTQFISAMQTGEVRPKGRRRYKPNTIRSYERLFRVHIQPSAVARIKVAEVRRSDLQALVDELLGSGLAAGTVGNVLNPIQAFYRRAVDRDELGYNPSERIDLPGGGTKRPKRIASPQEATELWRLLTKRIAPYGRLPSTPVCDAASCRLCASVTSTLRRT